MPRLTKKEKVSLERKENTLIFLKIILWPFKILYKLLFWTMKLLILGIEKIIGSFKDNKDIKQKTVYVSAYEPFRTIEVIKGSTARFESFLAKNPSTIGIIIGARGTGKSAIGLKILENMKSLSKKKFYAMGFSQDDIPDWIKSVNTLDELKNNSFVLIDEGGILFSARQSFSDANKLLSELLLIARHKDLSVIFISQNSANLEINAIRQTDYLILKPSSLLQMDFERKKIKEIYEEVQESFNKHKRIKGLTYIYCEEFQGFVSNPLPSFWSNNISKSFRNK